MNLVGDHKGLEQLRLMKESSKDFLKFLITEAKTSFSRSATFQAPDGSHWVLSYDAQKDELTVSPLKHM